jgi:thymidylate synthase ThyX
MELSRKDFEKQVSCELARTICTNIMRHRAALSMELVSASCRYVAILCKNNPECEAPASACAKAADALDRKTEKEYLEICAKAWGGCTLSRKAREEWKKAAERVGVTRRDRQPEVYR